MKRQYILICRLVFILVAANASYARAMSGGKGNSPQIVIPQIAIPLIESSQAPKIDGYIHEKEWSVAPRLIGMTVNGTELGARKVIFWLTSDGRNIYVAVRSELPPDGTLINKVEPKGTADRPVIQDDSIELWFAPQHESDEAADCFHIITNFSGALYDETYHAGDKQIVDRTYRVRWKYRSGLHDGWWDAEFAIPLTSLGANRKELMAHTWGIRIGRNWRQPTVQSEWAPREGPYNIRNTMAKVCFVEKAPLVRVLGLHGVKSPVDVRMEIANPAKTDLAVQVTLDHQTGGNPPHEIHRAITLDPSQAERFEVAEQARQGVARTYMRVTSPDNHQIYFERLITWRVQRPESVWSPHAVQKEQPVVFRFGYYPYQGKVKAKLDLSALSGSDQGKVKGATLTVSPIENGSGGRDKNSQPIASAAFPPFQGHVSQLILNVGNLLEGEYQIKARLQGDVEKRLEPRPRTFVNRKFVWEHNDLGVTDKVIPPFTPVKVAGNQVETVLRVHTVSDQGLLSQIMSEGVKILAAPIHFAVEADNKSQPIHIVRPVKVEKLSDAKARYIATWRAGPIQASVTGTFEQDGLLMLNLDLTPLNSQLVQKLDLVIPLRKQVATLMHDVTDTGHRFHYAGSIPQGTGIVWRSKEADRINIPGTFVPYIWIGDERQGMCWMAESARDWLIDENISTQTITRRKNGEVVLRIHLVTKPGALKRPRHIVMALQATPTKPIPQAQLPAPWRRIMVEDGSGSDKLPKDTYHVIGLGACGYWGGLASSGSIYPGHRNFQFYKILANARRTGKVNAKAVDQWLAGYGYQDRFPSLMEKYRRAAFAGVSRMARQPDAIFAYTAARCAGPATPEFQVFQDAWTIQPYTDRIWDTSRPYSSVEYIISPVRSYQDCRLYYMKKMLDSGAIDAIYFDLTYLQPDWDVVSGNAYYDDEGRLRPSIDLFEMRDYLKRVQVLANHYGIPWMNVAHMTNADVIPIMTWAGFTLDWEWHYGVSDYQDRFSRDLIRAESIGTQAGCIPLVLEGTRGKAKPEKIAHVCRTEFGVTAVHELKVWNFLTYQHDPDIQKWYNILYDFGYGDPDCKVYCYWEKPFPAAIQGVDAEALVLERQGKLLILVTNFGDTGTCTLELVPSLLSVPTTGHFVNAETGEEIQRIKSMACRFTLPKHDFRLIYYK